MRTCQLRADSLTTTWCIVLPWHHRQLPTANCLAGRERKVRDQVLRSYRAQNRDNAPGRSVERSWVVLWHRLAQAFAVSRHPKTLELLWRSVDFAIALGLLFTAANCGNSVLAAAVPRKDVPVSKMKKTTKSWAKRLSLRILRGLSWRASSPNEAFHEWGIPNSWMDAGWFIMENPLQMDDLGVPPFQETTKSIHSFQDASSVHWRIIGNDAVLISDLTRQ